MEYTMEERAQKIVDACLEEKGMNPVKMFFRIAGKDFVRIHGPEHHILDGAVILTAFANAGGRIELKEALEELINRGLQMPGAICGLWGVCGAVASMGAAFSIIDGTGPVTEDATWGNHMIFTSAALQALSEIGGPRCCKRDAFLSMIQAVEYIQKIYGISLEMPKIVCGFSKRNEQCLKEKCPFHLKGEQNAD